MDLIKKSKKQEIFSFFPKNRRGDKIISVYWFVVLVIVAGGIFGMVYIFYGTPYDVREVEANVLINKIADCVSYAGRINTNLIYNGQINQKTGEDFLKECHLNFKSKEWQDEQYYIEVNIYRLENLDNPVLSIDAGNKNWLSSCILQKNKEMEKLAKCVRKSFYSLDDKNGQYIIKILGVVRKTEKNVKL
jgi:hypothetical protein